MGLYRVNGKVARIDGLPFNDPACCFTCGPPACCCPPPNPLPASLDADEFVAPVNWNLTEQDAQPGECRRYYGEVDLTGQGLPSCRLFKVLVIWPEGCTDIDEVQVYYELGDEGFSLLTKDIEVCSPFCIQGSPTLINCGTNTLLTLGDCVPPPPECCCDPDDPLILQVSSLFPSFTRQVEMVDVGYLPGECRRYEASMTDLPGSCGVMNWRLVWPDPCSFVGITLYYTYQGSPYTEATYIGGGTCEPFCGRYSIELFDSCADILDVEVGCGLTLATSPPPAWPGPVPPMMPPRGTPRRSLPRTDLDKQIEALLDDLTPELEEWKRKLRNSDQASS